MEENNKKNVEGSQKNNEPTYEQLKNWLDQVVAQRNQVAEKLRQVTEVINKLPWLFKVLENKDLFDTQFVGDCVEEITYILTPPKEEEADNAESKDGE